MTQTLTIEHGPASASTAEEDRLSRQGRAILQLFLTAEKVRRSVRISELNQITSQCNTRLCEVRRHLLLHNYCIDLVERDTETGDNAYRLVPLCESTFYAEHKEMLLCGR